MKETLDSSKARSIAREKLLEWNKMKEEALKKAILILVSRGHTPDDVADMIKSGELWAESEPMKYVVKARIRVWRKEDCKYESRLYDLAVVEIS